MPLVRPSRQLFMADRPIERFLHYGADLAGASVGAAAEFFLPSTLRAGSLIAAGTANVIKEISARLLSPRERVRVSAATTFAIERISVRLLNGANPRSDGFFSESETAENSGKELLEAVLLKARDCFEERKVRYLGLFYANLIFADFVSPQTAHFSLKQLDRLSYRQLCFLSVLGSRGSLDVEALRRPNHAVPDIEALRREEMDLHSNDLGTMGLISGASAWVDELSVLGKVLYDLAGLEQIPPADKFMVEDLIASLPRV